MESNGDAPPFWSQTHPTHLLPRHHRRQPSSFLNPVALILIIPILLLILLFFLLPPFLSFATQIIRPNSVKKGWDYFNVLLVVFAVLCGVFVKRNDDASSSDGVAAAGAAATHRRNSAAVSSFVGEPKHSVTTWLEYPDRREYNGVESVAKVETGGASGGRMKRSSNSYPDLRQESLWENDDEERYKFFDDLEVVDSYESPPRENLHCRLRRTHEVETVVQEAPVDKFEVIALMPPEPVLPESPPASKTNLKKRRSYHSVPLEEEKKPADFEINEEKEAVADFEINEEEEADSVVNEAEKSENQPLAPLPKPAAPPPEPPIEEFEFPDVISETVPRKKSGATKEIASTLASLYKGQKKKMMNKKRVKSRDIYENAQPGSLPAPVAIAPPSTPPPPPPPPPPPNVFQNLFKKSSKNKRIHSVPTPPQPPPLPPNSIFDNIFKPGSITKRFQSSSTIADTSTAPPPPPPSSILDSLFKSGSNNSRFIKAPANPPQPPLPPTASDSPRQRNSNKPPKPPKRSSNQYNQTSIIAPPSPLIPLPPPPPPFRMKETKFAAKGDFVRISSRESLPELEDYDVMSVKSDGDESIGPSSVSCPSPDVNTKADNFIARLRGEWRLEKMNSVKENWD